MNPVVPKGKQLRSRGALNHIFGQEVGLGALLFGDTLILLPRMDLEDLFSHIEKYKASIFFCTPTLCRMILEHENVENYDFSSLVYVYTAGEALPVEVARKWTQKFKMPLYNGLGSTETCGGISLTPAGQPFPEGTGGKISPIKQVKLLDPDTQEPVRRVSPENCGNFGKYGNRLFKQARGNSAAICANGRPDVVQDRRYCAYR